MSVVSRFTIPIENAPFPRSPSVSGTDGKHLFVAQC